MRLGQFARKYDIRVQDLISYLEKEESKNEPLHSNTKLSEQEEAEILDFFGIEAQEEIEQPKVVELEEEKTVKEVIEIKEEKIVVDEDAWIDQDEPVFVEVAKEEKEIVAPKSSKPIPATPEEDIALAEGELDFMSTHEPEKVIESHEEEEQQKRIIDKIEPEKKPEPKEDEIIDTERLMELLESEEEIPELDKIKLIKASKKELSGLKVLGKVDLPEPKKKEDKEDDKEDEHGKKGRSQRSNPREDADWEERRLIAKAKREKNEARLAKLKKEKEEKERIARNAIHYKQKAGTSQPKKKKTKIKKSVTVEAAPTSPPQPKAIVKAHPQKEKPKSGLGKVWKWLTNPDT